MRQATTAIALVPLLPDWVPTSDINSVYECLGDDAVPPYGNHAPAEYTEIEKQRRYFSALLATFQTANENIMHREQRIELIKSRPESPHCISEEFKATKTSFGVPRRIANFNGLNFDSRIWRKTKS
jgi:hypothetical protein